MSVDPRTLPPVLTAALALALVTAATKVATGYLAASGCGPDDPRGVLHRDRRAGAHAVRGRVRSLAGPGGDAAGAVARGRGGRPGALTHGPAGLDDDAGPGHRPGWCKVVPAPQAEAERLRGRSSMVERLLPKQDTRVRFPSPAPHHDDGPGPLTRGTRGRVGPRRPARLTGPRGSRAAGVPGRPAGPRRSAGRGRARRPPAGRHRRRGRGTRSPRVRDAAWPRPRGRGAAGR